ncbi:MAG: PD-(D/E)XK nuclease family protein [bacterium]
MNRELENEFSWSLSRDRRFRDCERSYYWFYYGSWKGWDPAAPEPARQAYRLKQIKNLNQFAGTVVHELIKQTLERLRDGKPVSLEGTWQLARRRLNDGWKQSREKLWRQNAKHNLNLFEHHYGPEPPPEMIRSISERVRACLEKFFALPLLKDLLTLPTADWLTVDSLDAVSIEGLKFFAVPDFALRRGELVYLYDWKTGQPDEEYSRQLEGYALYAFHKWKTPPERQRLILVYLLDGHMEEVTPTAEGLLDFREMLLASVEAMRSRLDDPQTNAASAERLPMTDNRTLCPSCVFQEICFGGPAPR